MRHMEMIEPGGAMVKMEIAVDNLHLFTDAVKDIFLNMAKRCTKIKTKSKDSCDVAYEFNKCMKKGDINVSLILMASKVASIRGYCKLSSRIIIIVEIHGHFFLFL